MPSVEPITRIIIRQGYDVERTSTLLNQGEPAYTIDAKRLYVGDGSTLGGNPVGMRNCMFATFSSGNTNISPIYAPAIGDIVYDNTSRLVYTLVDSNYGLISSWTPIGVSLAGDGIVVSTSNDVISLIPNSIDFTYINTSSVGRGLELTNNGAAIRIVTPRDELTFVGNQLAIQDASVVNSMLASMLPNTIKGRTVAAGTPQDIPFDQLGALLAPYILQYAPAVSIVQTGTILDFGGPAAPAGYLECDGSAVGRDTYPVLFSIIGTTWGAGNGTTTFNLPNLTRRTTVGRGGSSSVTLSNTIGSIGGAESVILTANQSGLRSHNHGGSIVVNNTGDHQHYFGNGGGGDDGAFAIYADRTTPNRITVVPAGKWPGAGRRQGITGDGGGGYAYVDWNAGVSLTRAYVTSYPVNTNNSSSTITFTTTTATAAAALEAHNNVQPSAVVMKIIKY